MLTFWTVFLLSYLYHGMGITVGYHRLLSHRAFKCPRWVEYLIVSGGYLALEGSPVAWVATHRVHHRKSDQPGDPHSPVDGFWHSWAGWLIKPKVTFTGEAIEQTVPDLWRDPVYRFFDFNHTRTHAWVCLFLNILLRVGIFLWLGPIALVANLLGAILPFLGPFWVNSVCHLQEYGYRNFATEDGSRNVWWVGLIGLGEGWHNNHHAIPQSARHGMKPSEFDISWYFIKTLSLLGLATDIRMPRGSKNVPVLDAALAAQLNVPCATDAVIQADRMNDQLAVAKADLQEQLVAARALAAQLASTCDSLTEQVKIAKAGLVSNVAATREQISDQLLNTCDRLSEELANAKMQFGDQLQDKVTNLQGNVDQLAQSILPAREAETSI